MVSEIPRVSVFGHSPYSVTFPYIQRLIKYNNIIFIEVMIRIIILNEKI